MSQMSTLAGLLGGAAVPQIIGGAGQGKSMPLPGEPGYTGALQNMLYPYRNDDMMTTYHPAGQERGPIPAPPPYVPPPKPLTPQEAAEAEMRRQEGR